jgi:hypothetical protein
MLDSQPMGAGRRMAMAPSRPDVPSTSQPAISGQHPGSHADEQRTYNGAVGDQDAAEGTMLTLRN